MVVVCHSTCRDGGCCHHWVVLWQFYRRVVPVYVVNCKNIVNKAKKEKHTCVSSPISGGVLLGVVIVDSGGSGDVATLVWQLGRRHRHC